MAKPIETTPSSEWTVPNQSALELVVDARIAKLAASANTKVVKPTDKPADKPVDKPVDKPADKPAVKASEK